ncbi:MAG: class I SAM-dependent methyltransferase [Paracoccaceae bacterium]
MARHHRLLPVLGEELSGAAADGAAAFLNAHLFAGLEEFSGHLVCEQGFRPEHDRLSRAGLETRPVLDGRFSRVIVEAGRNRKLNMGTVARGCSMLKPGGKLIVDGQKTDGIDSLLRDLRKLLPVPEIFSKGHGKVGVTGPLEGFPDGMAAWLKGAAPTVNKDGFLTAPGMFGHAGVDGGSRRLAEHFSPNASGDAADLGAGWGWLSYELLRRAPSITRCDLFEADHAALAAARRNVADPRAGFHWSDVNEVSSGRQIFDLVVSNPPFHEGRAADPELGAQFVVAAAHILKPQGEAIFVANRQLPYESVFERNFAEWRIAEQDSAFKVIRATRPRGKVEKRSSRRRKR